MGDDENGTEENGTEENGTDGDVLKIHTPGHPEMTGRMLSFGSGGRIRTCDLRVMSPTSYRTALPRNKIGGY
jgi:hypothetical protein